MTTRIATGRDLTLTLAAQALSPQCGKVVLDYQNKIESYEVLTGTVKKVVKTEGSLTISMFQDFGAVTSFAEALWDAAETGTEVAFTFVADGMTFTGNVMPQFPSVGGGADAALESSIVFPLSGIVTKA